MDDIWLLVWGHFYARAGEVVQEILKEELYGRYEIIRFVPSLPQGISTSVPMKLDKDGYYECCSIQGEWEYDGEYLTIAYGPNEEIACVNAAWDFERGTQTIVLSGMSKKGIVFWAKKVGTL